MKGRIQTDSHAHEFRLLRNRIESQIQGPAVILVTSASDRDGAHLTAYGVAESLSKTHQRTALVMTSKTESAPPIPPGVDPKSMRRRGTVTEPGGVSIISISPERLATISRSNVAGLVEELRTGHDYVVIDGGDLPNNSFGLLLVASADATLVTFLAGRKEILADRIMLETLERSETKVLGVVLNDQAAIDHFTHEHETETKTEPVAIERPSALRRLEMAVQRIGKPS